MKNGNNSRDVPLMFAFSGSANLRALPKIWRCAGAVERSRNSAPSQSLTTRWVRLFDPQPLFPPPDVPCNGRCAASHVLRLSGTLAYLQWSLTRGAELLSVIGGEHIRAAVKESPAWGRARNQQRMKEQTND